MKSKYINPFTDFGFKKLFGEEASKPLLLSFLNSLLPEIHIVDLNFKDKEKQGFTENQRKAIYDIYCDTQSGEKIIVELQKAKQNYFKDRTIFYATFPIQEQADKNDWNFELKAVYCIGILDFSFENKSEKREVVHKVQLKNQHNQVFYNKLQFIYLEMPHFEKQEIDLETDLDKWLYFIKNLNDFEEIPEIFKGTDLFRTAFKKAELDAYTREEREVYEESLKIYRDLKGVIDTAFDEGKIEGKIEIARKLIAKGLDDELIVDSTDLTIEKIQELRKKL